MDNVTILARLESLDKKLHVKALEVAEAASVKLSRIVETFPHYTSHDAKHKARVLEICEWLAGSVLISHLTAPELFVLFSAIYLHDIGMALEPAERDAIEGLPEYQQFAATSGLNSVEALAEWVRRSHHKRSAEIVRSTHAEATGVAIRDAALAHATALICESHGESDLEDFDKYDPFFAYGTSATTICLPLLGVLLRLSDLLHLTVDRTPLAVIPLIRLTNAHSKMEWAKHLSTVGIAPLPDGTLRMSCICNDPGVHRNILRLCDYINQEFEYSKRIFAKLQAAGRPKYELTCCRVVPNVSAQGYEPWLDLRFDIDREGIIKLVTGDRIYHGHGAVVKELLMNAVDASRQARAYGKEPAQIRVEFSSAENSLSISDEGVGMDRTDLEEFLLRLGRCIYRSDIYQQRYTPPQRIDALSEFGIGFASCFLVADHVTVETKREEKDGFLLDLYDLLGFAAARTSSRITTGTTVTLHLKEAAIKDIEGAVKAIASTCPHVEIPIHVQADEEEMNIVAQPFYPGDDSHLLPFFQSRTTDLVIEHRHFTPEVENIAGCLYLLCQRKDGVVLPGYSEWFKLAHNDKRRVSQLGFALPDPNNWPNSLLGMCNLSTLCYDLDLCGDMRLEMDPSRTSILPSTHNEEVISRLDEYLVSYLYELHQRYWQALPREDRFASFLALGRMFFTRVVREIFCNNQKMARRLTDLLFDNMPLNTASRVKGSCNLTWNEIRDLRVPIVFYQRLELAEDYESHIESILNAMPGVLVVIEEPSYPYGNELMSFCTKKCIHVSEQFRRVYQVVLPWHGMADDLLAHYWSKERFNSWGFLLPFIPSKPYALAASFATRRIIAGSGWVNSSHPKIATFFAATVAAEKTGRKMPECLNFLVFLNQFHGGLGTDPEYVEYVQQHQWQALEELVRAGAIEVVDSETLLLRAEDFIPWERQI